MIHLSNQLVVKTVPVLIIERPATSKITKINNKIIVTICIYQKNIKINGQNFVD